MSLRPSFGGIASMMWLTGTNGDRRRRAAAGLAACLVYLCLHLAALFLKHVTDDNLGPFPGEHPGLHGPHTPGPTADQGHLVFQTHRFPQISFLYHLICYVNASRCHPM